MENKKKDQSWIISEIKSTRRNQHTKWCRRMDQCRRVEDQGMKIMQSEQQKEKVIWKWAELKGPLGQHQVHDHLNQRGPRGRGKKKKKKRAKGEIHMVWKLGGSRNGKKATRGAKWEGQADYHRVVEAPDLSCLVFFAVHVVFGWLSLLLSSSVICGLTCPKVYWKGPTLPLMVLCSYNGTCNEEPNGGCYGSSSSHFWDAHSLTCVSSLCRQWSIRCLTREHASQEPGSI